LAFNATVYRKGRALQKADDLPGRGAVDGEYAGKQYNFRKKIGGEGSTIVKERGPSRF